MLIKKTNLRVNNEYFALWDSNLPVTKLIRVSIAKSRVEWIIIRREKSFDILRKNINILLVRRYILRAFPRYTMTRFCAPAVTSRQAILNS